jgi:mono/diheme cytochrome c family protein
MRRPSGNEDGGRGQEVTSEWTIHRVLLVSANALALLAAPGASADSQTVQARGATVFAQYCVLCHGRAGKGDGRAALMQKVPPADLTVSALSADDKRRIVFLGGAGVGRSASMPAWAEVLTEEQIEDVLVYLDSLIGSVSATHISGAGRQ